jgi:hypothetical protein
MDDRHDQSVVPERDGDSEVDVAEALIGLPVEQTV